jgi:hypothetical protein
VLVRPAEELHGVVLLLFIKEDGDEGVGGELATAALSGNDGRRRGEAGAPVTVRKKDLSSEMRHHVENHMEEGVDNRAHRRW